MDLESTGAPWPLPGSGRFVSALETKLGGNVKLSRSQRPSQLKHVIVIMVHIPRLLNFVYKLQCFQGFLRRKRNVGFLAFLGPNELSVIERCPYYRGVRNERLDCIPLS